MSEHPVAPRQNAPAASAPVQAAPAPVITQAQRDAARLRAKASDSATAMDASRRQQQVERPARSALR